MLEDRTTLPDINRISVTVATILLAYATTRFVDIQPLNLVIHAPGVVLDYTINFKTIVALLVALMGACGSEWIIRSHPAYEKASPSNRLAIQHWILPALTAWVVCISLNTLITSLEWWIVFSIGGVLLIGVFAGEYRVVDVSDVRHPLASVGLTAFSFALYLILTIALKAADMRVYLLVPGLILAVWVVSLRSLYLRLGGSWVFSWATVIAIIVGQIGMGLHYFPISSVRYGLILLAFSYALTSLAGVWEEKRPWQERLIEPGVAFILILGLALWIG